jgi:trimethylamine:corrinoid methyltransferase-like protein
MTCKRISLVECRSFERVHKESLRVLENVGVRVADPECIRILKMNGAKVHGQAEESQTMLVRAHRRVVGIVSQSVTFRAPESAVKRIKQYVRDEARSLRLPPPAWTE